MKDRILHLAAGLLLLLFAANAYAQEEASDTPVQVGPYTFSGTLSAGYRVTDISIFDDRNTNLTVAENLFNEQFNLRKGLKAFDLNLYGEKPVHGEGLFDQIFLNASSSGPYTNGSLRLRRLGSFDFKVDYQRSEYFFNRFDSLYTDLRTYDMTRDRLSASLSVTPIEQLDIAVTYSMNNRSGDQSIPRSLFYEIPTSFATWGSAGRANFYSISTPRTDKTNDISGRATLRLPLTAISIAAGSRSYSEDLIGTPVSDTSLTFQRADSTPNDLGIIGNNKVKEVLTAYRWQDKRDVSATWFSGEVVFKPIDMLSATASFQTETATGNGSIAATQVGTVRLNNSGSILTPYRGSVNGTSTQEGKTLTAGIDLSFRPIPELAIMAGFNVKNVDNTTGTDYRITLDTALRGSTPPQFSRGGTDSIQHLDVTTTYKIPQQTISGNVYYAPLSNLSIRGGIRLVNRKPEVRPIDDGALDSASSVNLSKETSFTTITGNVSYRPIKELLLRARVESMTGKSTLEGTTTEVDFAPRRVPKDDLGIGGSIDVTPIDGLSLSLGLGSHSGKNDLIMPNVTTTIITPELEHSSKNLNGSISYTTSDWPLGPTTIMFCGNYQENNFSIPSSFTRGTFIDVPPFGTTSRDSLTVIITENTIDRYIGASISVRPIAALDIMVGYDMVRTTGGSQMTQSVPANFVPTTTATKAGDISRMSAPFTQSIISGHVQYDIIRRLGIAVDAKLISMKEDPEGFSVALNNFKATLLTFSLIVKL
jgi:hypothetical protein